MPWEICWVSLDVILSFFGGSDVDLLYILMVVLFGVIYILENISSLTCNVIYKSIKSYEAYKHYTSQEHWYWMCRWCLDHCSPMSWTPLTRRQNHAYDGGLTRCLSFLNMTSSISTWNHFEDWISYGIIRLCQTFQGHYLGCNIYNLEKIGGPKKYRRKSSIHMFFIV